MIAMLNQISLAPSDSSPDLRQEFAEDRTQEASLCKLVVDQFFNDENLDTQTQVLARLFSKQPHNALISEKVKVYLQQLHYDTALNRVQKMVMQLALDQLGFRYVGANKTTARYALNEKGILEQLQAQVNQDVRFNSTLERFEEKHLALKKLVQPLQHLSFYLPKLSADPNTQQILSDLILAVREKLFWLIERDLLDQANLPFDVHTLLVHGAVVSADQLKALIEKLADPSQIHGPRSGIEEKIQIGLNTFEYELESRGYYGAAYQRMWQSLGKALFGELFQKRAAYDFEATLAEGHCKVSPQPEAPFYQPIQRAFKALAPDSSQQEAHIQHIDQQGYSLENGKVIAAIDIDPSETIEQISSQLEGLMQGAEVSLYTCPHQGVLDQLSKADHFVKQPPQQVQLLNQDIRTFFEDYNLEKQLLILCQGSATALVHHCLKQLEPKLRARISVIALAPKVNLDPKLCSKVVNLVSSKDIFIDPKETGSHYLNLKSLNWSLLDQNFTSSTYQEVLKRLIEGFIDENF